MVLGSFVTYPVTFFLDNLRHSAILKLTIDLTPKLRIAAKDTVPHQNIPARLWREFWHIYREAASFSGCSLFLFQEEITMETRVAVISIIIENPESVQPMNDILHQYSEYIIGRMGIPYRSKGINIISIAVDAPQDKISAMSGKIGRLDGVTSKAAYSK